MIARILRVVGQVLLSVTAVVGVCCLLITLAGVLFGVRPLIFRSGSMSPTITTGSLAIARSVDADRLKVGDIVSVPVSDIRIAHRITKINEQHGGATLQLKGDANPVPDARSYRVFSADKIVFSVPALGSLIAWLSHAPGIFVLAGYAALMLTLVLRRRPGSGPSNGDRHHDQYQPRRAEPQVRGRRFATERTARVPALLRLGRLRPTRLLGATAVLSLLPVLQATPSWAAWNDTASVSTPTNAISTYTVPAPTLKCGTVGLLSVPLSWSAVQGATNYTVYADGAAVSTTTGTSTTLGSSLVDLSGTAYVKANITYGSTVWSSTNSNSVGYTVAVVSLCS